MLLAELRDPQLEPVGPVHRQIVAAEHHILRRANGRLAGRRVQDVARREHQRARLLLRALRERHMDGHLVAVEVGVERRADQRMQLDGAALHQHRLERLDAQTVQSRRPVEQHRVVVDHLFEDVPNLRPHALDEALGTLDIVGKPLLDELAHDERLEELERHFLRQATLVQLELRADHDHRAARIVHTLAQQVLAEAALLALEHVRQALELVVAGTGHRAAAPPVISVRRPAAPSGAGLAAAPAAPRGSSTRGGCRTCGRPRPHSGASWPSCGAGRSCR